jgi:SlyX protein
LTQAAPCLFKKEAHKYHSNEYKTIKFHTLTAIPSTRRCHNVGVWPHAEPDNAGRRLAVTGAAKRHGENLMTEERLIDIELKLTHQEDTVDALNKIVYEQQKKIDQLEKLIAALARQVKDNASSTSERSIDNERPPHY